MTFRGFHDVGHERVLVKRILHVFAVMMDRNGWRGCSSGARGEILTFPEEHLMQRRAREDISVDQERQLGDRRRLHTVVVPTVNDADPPFGGVERTRRVTSVAGRVDDLLSCDLREIFKFMGSGGSMVTRLKVGRIDGISPPGVEFAA